MWIRMIYEACCQAPLRLRRLMARWRLRKPVPKHVPDLPKITGEWLQNIYAGFPAEIARDYGRRHFVMWTAILARIFGARWVERHFLNPTSADAKGFMKLDFSADHAREHKSLRAGLLAEMLVNLQNVPGFEHPVAQMRNGQVESGFAELDCGKLLYVNE